jgi:hypothetical protein
MMGSDGISHHFKIKWKLVMLWICCLVCFLMYHHTQVNVLRTYGSSINYQLFAVSLFEFECIV